MNNSKTSLVLIVLTMLTLSAGFSAGMLTHRVSIAGPGEQATNGTSLVEQLRLSPQQQEQMRQIWESVRSDVQDSYQQAQDLQRLRDQAVADILTDEQKAQFEKIAQDYAGRFTAIVRKREQTFTRGVERTRMLLDDSQRKQYDLIVKDRLQSTQTAGMGEAPR